MKRFMAIAMLLFAATASAQTPAATNADEKLREVLPADVAGRVIARIEEARARQLPAQALERRALELAAKGAPPADVLSRVDEHARNLDVAKSAIERARGSSATDAEIVAGAEALSHGADGAMVSAVAKNAAANGGSIAVAYAVLAELASQGVPVAKAMEQVTAAMQRRASESELRQLPEQARGRKPEVTGRDLSGTKRPAAGRPAAVPANPGTVPTPPVGGTPTGRP